MMTKAIPHTKFDIAQLERELVENGYDREEIDEILQEARSINSSSFYPVEDVYEFLYKLRMQERDY
ncbi:TPA: hypothetical protein DEP21_05660 [Patescibacteria group bacterium]|nr:hypothetical protein [Candidatus Gracilibacteria bacterium]